MGDPTLETPSRHVASVLFGRNEAKRLFLTMHRERTRYCKLLKA